ncbi:glycosyltransferase family 2 protein [Dyadobacter sp. CY356]|uniref:glycosyltransferase family 2 protein n=1 Tax=Dyadobacter sp. CY356 TaxID=2906442 RepID=UPI001F239035|nr:glycosyltransferase family 2 protein [Dyadobacter sp. CY356]MCF0056994.1 glycosyltransferase family 2 protein [Dyadobacter sp. CY356]
MAESPLISIALCTYNGEEFIKEQMDSLLCQSYANLEIIVVDDCSTDNTVSVLNQFVVNNTKIKLYRNDRNLGYNKNFEKAIKLCNGAFIAMCDQDDIWDTDKIKIQFEAIGDSELIYHDSEFIDSLGNPIHFKMSDKFNFYKGNSPLPFLYMNCVSGHSVLIKKSLLDSGFPFPEGFHYDQWLAFMAAYKGKIDFVDKCLVQYRQHDRNSTDILAVRSKHQKTSKEVKIEKLKQESLWLKVCSEHSQGANFDLIMKLYQLCLKRNTSFINLSYGWKIWKNEELLLFLLKKNKTSKFFFTLRKIWGPGTKRII